LSGSGSTDRFSDLQSGRGFPRLLFGFESDEHREAESLKTLLTDAGKKPLRSDSPVGISRAHKGKQVNRESMYDGEFGC